MLPQEFRFPCTNFLENWQNLPNEIQVILYKAITALLGVCVGLGMLLAIVGVIQWATGWEDRGGKKLIVKGIVLILIGLASGGGMITLMNY
ncbi:MAG: hypothetical protein GF308_12625 [Candidatus Heimdallarchaeota archaeon]|nr:hypothetical protein [Candidatus Heimdallarchaeota archaeon]